MAALWAFLLFSPAHAEVIRFEVLQSGPAFEGRSFGSVGPYVKITARATIAVDPADPRNAIIADIDKAPRDDKGLVEATADVVLLRPADPRRGNGTLLVDIPNRGTKLAPQLFDDAAKPGATTPKRPPTPESVSCTARATPWPGSAGRPTFPQSRPAGARRPRCCAA